MGGAGQLLVRTVAASQTEANAPPPGADDQVQLPHRQCASGVRQPTAVDAERLVYALGGVCTTLACAQARCCPVPGAAGQPVVVAGVLCVKCVKLTGAWPPTFFHSRGPSSVVCRNRSTLQVHVQQPTCEGGTPNEHTQRDWVVRRQATSSERCVAWVSPRFLLCRSCRCDIDMAARRWSPATCKNWPCRATNPHVRRAPSDV